jgi:hypothetical protein
MDSTAEPVLLQAKKEEPTLDAKCKDKFLFQTITITPKKEGLFLPSVVSPGSLAFILIRRSVTDI